MDDKMIVFSIQKNEIWGAVFPYHPDTKKAVLFTTKLKTEFIMSITSVLEKGSLIYLFCRGILVHYYVWVVGNRDYYWN